MANYLGIERSIDLMRNVTPATLLRWSWLEYPGDEVFMLPRSIQVVHTPMAYCALSLEISIWKFDSQMGSANRPNSIPNHRGHREYETDAPITRERKALSPSHTPS